MSTNFTLTPDNSTDTTTTAAAAATTTVTTATKVAEETVTDLHSIDNNNDNINNYQMEDFSQMERLSSEYTPDATGPLIGHLKSSKELEAEYANADPAFVRKTNALTPNYSYYRTVRGDGNCGWRAVAFGFFETLIKSGDFNKIGMQHARIKSLNGLMGLVGVQPYIYEDFADTTFDLLAALRSNSPFNIDELVKTFNNPEVSDSIVTHIKLLTSAWMKTRPDNFLPFLEMKTIAEYCSAHIEPYRMEIDHVGLMALIDCLILPAGMVVEVFYLDRSPGEAVNVHRFEKLEGEDLTPPDAPVLRLLYRPGHYDIIYKREEVDDIPPPVYQQPIQVSCLPSLPHQNFPPTPLAGYGHQMAGLGYQHDPHYYEGPSITLHLPANNYRDRQSTLSAQEYNHSSSAVQTQEQPYQTNIFRNSPFNPSHFQSENFQPEIYQPTKRAKRTPNQNPRIF